MIFDFINSCSMNLLVMLELSESFLQEGHKNMINTYVFDFFFFF
jgi:hypothetical protein